MKQFVFVFNINNLISSILQFDFVYSKRYNNNKNIENNFAININNIFVVQNIFLNYIQNDFVKKKRERYKNDIETSSKNRKYYNYVSIEYLLNECNNFHISEHVLVN